MTSILFQTKYNLKIINDILYVPTIVVLNIMQPE